MKIYLDVDEDHEKPEYVEIIMEKPFVTTIPMIQQVARIIWPAADIDRIWLTPANYSHGVRLTNIDLKHSYDTKKSKKKAQ